MFLLILFLISIELLCAQQNECGSGPKKCINEINRRSFDGSCNNIEHPQWGSAFALYRRLLPAQYDDGVSSFRKAKSGKQLPNPRLLSSFLYKNKEILDPKLTLNAMQFGQVFAHDLGNRLIIGSNDCCSSFKFTSKNNSCQAIPIPKNDPVYSEIAGECLPFQRTTTNFDQNCSDIDASAEQLNQFSAYLDLNAVYESTDQANRAVRTLKRGQFKVNHINDQDWFIKSPNPETDCFSKPNTTYCFKSDDNRINQNPHLAILNVILLREHNRIAATLSEINPHWEDERIFDTARTILIGMFQHISFYELIPVYINKTILYENRILFETDGFVDDYDPQIDASTFTEFAQAAFRYAHSMVAGSLKFADENRNLRDGVELKNSYFDVSLLQKGENFDLLTRGLSTQHSYAADSYHEVAVTHYLFKSYEKFGEDLKAIDIQRSRDHGIASYNDYRMFCNMTRAVQFSDFADVIETRYIELLSRIYEHPDDVDLTVGGSLEKLLPGGLAGPTFTCIWLKQLKNTRTGDRFFYDHKNGPFTLEQLHEIRKSSISRWFCDNTRHITKMQPKGFVLISKKNELLPCDSLPTVDLTKWRES